MMAMVCAIASHFHNKKEASPMKLIDYILSVLYTAGLLVLIALIGVALIYGLPEMRHYWPVVFGG